MGVAKLDQNSRPSLTAVSNADGTTVVPLYADPITHRVLVDLPSGSGIASINSDTTSAQTLTTGTTGTDFAIVDNGSGDHKFNLPSASASARGLVTTGAQTIAGAKTFSTAPILSSLTASQAVVTDGSKNLASLGYSVVANGSMLVERDLNGNIYGVNSVSGTTQTAGGASAVQMTGGSNLNQQTTGTGNNTFYLPDSTTLILGWKFEFNNDSTGIITVKLYNNGTTVGTIPAGGFVVAICTDNSTQAGVWDTYVFGPDGITQWGTAGLTLAGYVNSNDVQILGSSTGYTQLNSGLTGASNNTLTLPITATDTLAGLGTAQTFTASQTFQKVVQTVTPMSAQALDGTLGNVFTRTLGASETFTQSGFTAGQCFMVEVKQNTGTSYTVTWFAGVTWITSGATAPVQTTTTNGTTVYGFRCTGTNTFIGMLMATQ